MSLIDFVGLSVVDDTSNSSLPGQNGRHFADDIFRWILVTENVCILIKILSNFVPKGPIYYNPDWFR